MKRKFKSKAGLTLVELLAATVVLMLLGLILNSGINVALSSYRDLTSQAEVELLLSTAVDALANDLRYARNVKDSDTGAVNYNEDVPFIYTSDSFAGQEIQLKLDKGKIVANTDTRFLPDGAYGKNDAYAVKSMVIKPQENNTFTITLEVGTAADSSISAETSVTVRCLNKMNVTTS